MGVKSFVVDTGSELRAIVVGYGLAGRGVTDELTAAGVNVTIVEINPNTVATQKNLKRSALHGDATDPTVLKEAGVETASMLILTIPDEDVVIRSCEAARKLAPDLYIVARTNHASQAAKATAAGANHVTVEEIVTTHAMQNVVTRHLADISSPQPD